MVTRRRVVLALGAGALATPLSAFAQLLRGDKPFRVGSLPDFVPAYRAFFSEAMLELGWVEGRNFIIAEPGIKMGGDQIQIEKAANIVVDDKPDVIFAVNEIYAIAAYRLTTTIPIVMLYSGYPVESGLALSLARPGKNVTGNSIYAGTGIWGKLIELLRDAKPGIKRIGAFWDYVPPALPREEVEPAQRDLMLAARTLGLTLNLVEIAHPSRVTAAMAEIEAGRPDALLVTSGPGLYDARQRIMEFAVKRRLPTIVDAVWAASFDPAPLLAYAARPRDLVRNAASYVDRILKGTKPGDLPIQLPVTFNLTVNKKTAKALRLIIPNELLLRADRVIE